MKKSLIVLLLLVSGSYAADDLNLTIKGKLTEEAELDSLSPDPAIPPPDSILFSLDGGKAAQDDEVNPLSVFKAALLSDESKVPAPMLPLIPESPFFLQRLPLGDQYDVKRNIVFGKAQEDKMNQNAWEWTVKDQKGTLIHRSTGSGRPPDVLWWDGHSEKGFQIKTDVTYNSYLVLKSTDKDIGTWPGEAVRYMALTFDESDRRFVELGERIYADGSRQFSKEGKIFLSDLYRQLYTHIHISSYSADAVADWQVTLFEPSTTRAESKDRRALWTSTLENVLGQTFSEEKIKLTLSDSNRSFVWVELINPPESTRPLMTGTPSPPRPKFEDKSDWVLIKQSKNDLIVGLRHDRLFRSGSAFLRDEALPLLTGAFDAIDQNTKIQSVKNDAEFDPFKKRNLTKKERKKLKKAEKKRLKKLKKERKKNPAQTIILKSYTEKVHDPKRNKKELDPQLATLRSKVLFMLFAHARYLR